MLLFYFGIIRRKKDKEYGVSRGIDFQGMIRFLFSLPITLTPQMTDNTILVQISGLPLSPHETDSQVDASLQIWTCVGWPNGIASRLASSCKSQNFMHIQMTCDQLVSTCAKWPNGEKLASTCVRNWTRPKSTEVHASHCKWVASWTQVENLRRLASPFGQNFKVAITATSFIWDAINSLFEISTKKILNYQKE